MKQRRIRALFLTLLLFSLIFCGLVSCDLVGLSGKKDCTATFVVDEHAYSVRTACGSVPVYPNGTPEKEPQDGKEFVFIGWSPSLGKISEDTTYTALFEERTRRFDVTVKVTPEGAGSVFGEGKAETGSDATLRAEEAKGYRFLGWYENGKATDNSAEKQITIYNIEENREIEARFAPISFPITYCVPSGTINENPETYDITMGEVVLKVPRRDGYIFDGFTTEADGKGERVRTLTYDLVSVSPTLYANFVPSAKVTFCVTGDKTVYIEEDFVLGRVPSPPAIDGAAYGMSAYAVRGWYADEACGTPADFSLSPETGMIYYAVWEYRGNTGFAPYLEKFVAARASGTVHVSSEEELIALVDFVRFCNLSEDAQLRVEFSSAFCPTFENAKQLSAYVSSLIERGEFPNSIGLSYSYSSDSYRLSAVFSSQSVESEGTRCADPDGAGQYLQYEYAHRITSPGRAADFDAFPIENIKSTLAVSTSNQLVYALEHGFRPLPEVGSTAERVYLAAKAVLRRIVDDDMNDFDKLRAIYEWLILTVRYDHTAADEVGTDWRFYDAWYPEGVFFCHAAVCDGIAKSFLILARIENIACVRISGTSIGGVGHAWNKVCLDGAWYGVDATEGNLSVGKEEYLSYTAFLFTDAYKEQKYRFTILPKTATPQDGINVYARMEFGEGLLRYDLYLNGIAELERLAAAMRRYTSDAGGYDGVTSHRYVTVEVAVADGSGVTPDLLCRKLGVSTYVSLTASDGISVYALRLPLAESGG